MSCFISFRVGLEEWLEPVLVDFLRSRLGLGARVIEGMIGEYRCFGCKESPDCKIVQTMTSQACKNSNSMWATRAEVEKILLKPVPQPILKGLVSVVFQAAMKCARGPCILRSVQNI